MSLVSFQSFATVFSQMLPEGSAYMKGHVEDDYMKDGSNLSVFKGHGSPLSKEEMSNFALKIFNFKPDENITIQGQSADLFGVVTNFCVSRPDSHSCGTIDQRGTVGLMSASEDSTLSRGSSLTIELKDKNLRCTTAGETVVCAATVDGQPVVDRDLGWTSYAVGGVAFCVGAYYAGKIIVKNTKTMYESAKTLFDCYKVVTLKIAKELEEKFTEDSTSKKDGSEFILLPIVKDIWKKRNEIKTSKGEPLGKAHYRATVDLMKAEAKIVAVSTLGVVAAATAYFRF